MTKRRKEYSNTTTNTWDIVEKVFPQDSGSSVRMHEKNDNLPIDDLERIYQENLSPRKGDEINVSDHLVEGESRQNNSISPSPINGFSSTISTVKRRRGRRKSQFREDFNESQTNSRIFVDNQITPEDLNEEDIIEIMNGSSFYVKTKFIRENSSPKSEESSEVFNDDASTEKDALILGTGKDMDLELKDKLNLESECCNTVVCNDLRIELSREMEKHQEVNRNTTSSVTPLDDILNHTYFLGNETGREIPELSLTLIKSKMVNRKEIYDRILESMKHFEDQKITFSKWHNIHTSALINLLKGDILSTNLEM
jgi:hypothetical protein